jgi:predicted esterase
MSRSPQSPPFVIEPADRHTQSFILLHGVGSNGEKFGAELLETAITSNGQKLTNVFPGARFIFPTAKKRRSAAFGRTVINQWFDISSLDDPSLQRDRQYDGLADSADYLLKILAAELELIPAEQIMLGGLSQGCAMALSLTLGLDFALAGLIGMSGWLPFQRDLVDLLNVSNETEDVFASADPNEEPRDATVDALLLKRDILSLESTCADKIKACLSTPVFIGHGEDDEKVRVSLGKDIVSTLQALGMDVTWKTYDQGHWYKIPEEIDDIVQFIQTRTSFQLSTQ